MTKKQKITSIILYILIGATLIFIWSNSMRSIEESLNTSTSFTEILTPFLGVFFGRDNVTDHLVRKMAHFGEFGLLGIELSILLICRNRVKLQSIINCLFLALSTAVIDESIQILFERGSQVQDVLLDFSGAFTFISLLIISYFIICGIKATKQKKAVKKQ